MGVGMKYIQFPSGVIVSLQNIKMVGRYLDSYGKILGVSFLYDNCEAVKITLDDYQVPSVLNQIADFLAKTTTINIVRQIQLEKENGKNQPDKENENA